MFWILFILLIVLIILGFVLWLVYQVLFQPTSEMIWEPPTRHQNIFFESSPSNCNDLGKPYYSTNKPKGECINCWYFDNYPKGKIILFFHGNSGNISYCSHIVDFCKRYRFNLLLVDYRGYGKSDGIPTIGNICQDGKAAYSFLRRKEYSPNQIIVWGESMGGAVATYVASIFPICHLVLMSTFSSLDDAITKSDRSALVKIPFGLLLGYFVQPIPIKKWIRKVDAPILIIHSRNDTFIPYKNAEILYDNISHKEKKLVTIKGDHNSPDFTLDQLKCIMEEIKVPSQYLTSRNLQTTAEFILEACALHQKDLN